jgi:hypothetical protein
VAQYTVIWWQAADAELLRLWLDSSDRGRITEAAREVDKLLSARGASSGESVHEGLYALEVAPLHVQFSVEEDDRLVRVWTVRLVR